MSVQSSLYSGVQSVFSGRLFPIVAPAVVTLPYATYQIVAQVPQNVLSDTPNVYATRLQIDIFATTASQCETLKGSVRTAVVTTFGNSAKENLTFELFEEEAKIYRVMMDWSVWHN